MHDMNTAMDMDRDKDMNVDVEGFMITMCYLDLNLDTKYDGKSSDTVSLKGPSHLLRLAWKCYGSISLGLAYMWLLQMFKSCLDVTSKFTTSTVTF